MPDHPDKLYVYARGTVTFQGTAADFEAWGLPAPPPPEDQPKTAQRETLSEAGNAE